MYQVPSMQRKALENNQNLHCVKWFGDASQLNLLCFFFLS